MYCAVYMIAIKRYVDHHDLTRFIKPKMLLITNHYKHRGGEGDINAFCSRGSKNNISNFQDFTRWVYMEWTNN